VTFLSSEDTSVITSAWISQGPPSRRTGCLRQVLNTKEKSECPKPWDISGNSAKNREAAALTLWSP
jgi:hypothetical protein